MVQPEWLMEVISKWLFARFGLQGVDKQFCYSWLQCVLCVQIKVRNCTCVMGLACRTDMYGDSKVWREWFGLGIIVFKAGSSE